MITNKNLSPELILQPWRGGIRIIPSSSSMENSNTRLADLEKLPFNSYLIDTNSAINYINPIATEANGFYSQQSALGKIVSDYAEKISAIKTLQNHRAVLTHKRKMMIEQEYKLKLKTFFPNQFLIR